MPAVLHGGRPGRYRRKQQGTLAGIQGLPLQGRRVRHDEGAGAYKGQEGDVRQRRQDAYAVRDLLLPLLETGKGGRMLHQQDGTLLPGVQGLQSFQQGADAVRAAEGRRPGKIAKDEFPEGRSMTLCLLKGLQAGRSCSNRS